MEGNGCTRETHGTKLCEKNRDFVEEVIRLYNKYEYTCPITLEVGEQDYDISANYKESKRIIDEYR